MTVRTIDYERFQLKRVNPLDGLMIDAATWRDAHDYHRNHQRLHNLAAHGSGIVLGLDVVANSPPDGSVVINPGLAIDPEGNALIVAQSQRYFLKASGAGTTYLVIQFREIPMAADSGGADGQESRILEAYRIQERDRLPDEPYIELARIATAGRVDAIADAVDRLNPGLNEIDLRFRPMAGVRPQMPLPIAQALVRAPQPGTGHRLGVNNLANELNHLGMCQARLIGALALEAGPPDCSLLYLLFPPSWTPNKQEMASLGYFLSRGGVALLEPCLAAGESGAGKQTEVAFAAIAQQLGLSPAPVKGGHPLLSTRFIFGQCPPGLADDGAVLEAQGLIYSGRDYGCAWQGGGPERPLAREVIRGALEFGVNVALYALDRRSRALRT